MERYIKHPKYSLEKYHRSTCLDTLYINRYIIKNIIMHDTGMNVTDYLIAIIQPAPPLLHTYHHEHDVNQHPASYKLHVKL